MYLCEMNAKQQNSPRVTPSPAIGAGICVGVAVGSGEGIGVGIYSSENGEDKLDHPPRTKIRKSALDSQVEEALTHAELPFPNT